MLWIALKFLLCQGVGTTDGACGAPATSHVQQGQSGAGWLWCLSLPMENPLPKAQPWAAQHHHGSFPTFPGLGVTITAGLAPSPSLVAPELLVGDLLLL